MAQWIAAAHQCECDAAEGGRPEADLGDRLEASRPVDVDGGDAGSNHSDSKQERAAQADETLRQTPGSESKQEGTDEH